LEKDGEEAGQPDITAAPDPIRAAAEGAHPAHALKDEVVKKDLIAHLK